MQKIAAQVGDKKLIKLRLYRQTDRERYKKDDREWEREMRERTGGIAGLSTHGSVSVKCRASAWTSVGGCRRGASRVRAVKII